jgi:hypothetical protein
MGKWSSGKETWMKSDFVAWENGERETVSRCTNDKVGGRKRVRWRDGEMGWGDGDLWTYIAGGDKKGGEGGEERTLFTAATPALNKT